MTTLLTMGPVHNLVQNVVYALPARAPVIFSDVALEIANDSAFAAPEVVPAATPMLISAAFVRCTTGAAIVTLRLQ